MLILYEQRTLWVVLIKASLRFFRSALKGASKVLCQRAYSHKNSTKQLSSKKNTLRIPSKSAFIVERGFNRARFYFRDDYVPNLIIHLNVELFFFLCVLYCAHGLYVLERHFNNSVSQRKTSMMISDVTFRN